MEKKTHPLTENRRETLLKALNINLCSRESEVSDLLSKYTNSSGEWLENSGIEVKTCPVSENSSIAYK